MTVSSQLWKSAAETDSRETFIHSHPELDETLLSDLWDDTHIQVSDIRRFLGMTQKDFAERYFVSKRTVEAWESSTGDSKRRCPAHLVVLMARDAGYPLKVL